MLRPATLSVPTRTHPQKCAEAGVTLTPSACRGGRASLSPSVRILYHSTAFFESRFRVPSCEEITTVPGGLSPSLTLISRLDLAMVCLILFLVILSVASANVVKTNGRKMSLGKGNRREGRRPAWGRKSGLERQLHRGEAGSQSFAATSGNLPPSPAGSSGLHSGCWGRPPLQGEGRRSCPPQACTSSPRKMAWMKRKVCMCVRVWLRVTVCPDNGEQEGISCTPVVSIHPWRGAFGTWSCGQRKEVHGRNPRLQPVSSALGSSPEAAR